MTASLAFFPVSNGDMTLVVLDNGQTILIDINIRGAATTRTTTRPTWRPTSGTGPLKPKNRC